MTGRDSDWKRSEGSAMADSKSHVLYNEPALPGDWAVMEGRQPCFLDGLEVSADGTTWTDTKSLAHTEYLTRRVPKALTAGAPLKLTAEVGASTSPYVDTGCPFRALFIGAKVMSASRGCLLPGVSSCDPYQRLQTRGSCQRGVVPSTSSD